MTLRALPLLLATLVLTACDHGGGGGATGGGSGAGGGQGGGGGASGSTLTLGWSFDGRTCAQQLDWAAAVGVPAVATLTVDLNGQPLSGDGGFGCTNGAAGDGVALPGVADGTAAYTVHAWSASGEELFQGVSSASVSGDTTSTVTLHALKGGLAFTWHFWDGANYVDCADAGVSSLTVNLKHAASGALVYGDAGTQVACPTPWGDGLQLPWLAPGRYFIYLQARDAADAGYGTDPISPPRADVDAGVYPRVEDVSQPAELYHQ